MVQRSRLRHSARFPRAGYPPADHPYRFVRHDRDLTFSWIYSRFHALRLALSNGHPVPVSAATLDERLLRFAGRPRLEQIQQLTATDVGRPRETPDGRQR